MLKVFHANQFVARRPHVRGAFSALVKGGSRVYRGGENLGMGGPEDNGGEGQLGREPGYFGGGQFFPKKNQTSEFYFHFHK